MPHIKNALIRYRIIDRCIRNKYKSYPSKKELREACEESLYGSSDGANICDSTIEKDMFAMKIEHDAPIRYSKRHGGYYYEDPDFSINDIPLTEEDLNAIKFAVKTLTQFRDVSMFRQFGSAIDKIVDRVSIATNPQDKDLGSFVQFETSVSNGGGITGTISGSTLTLGSNGSSANGASTIVTRGADGSFGGNVITAVYGNIWGNAGTGSATFSGGTTLARLSGNTSSYSEPRLEFGEQTNNATAAISSKNEGNGGGSLYFLTRNTSAASSTVTRMRITGDGNLVVYGNILTNLANGVSTIGNSTNYFGNIYGTAMLARYADLAESYSADQYYSPGTVVEFGGIKEITLASNETARVAGVISTKPAYLMNMEQQGDNMLAVALQGRVPCQVLGVVHKGDMMVSAGNGYAKACSTPAVGTIIGKALENHFSSSDGLIEVVVGIR
jgi:hypothetical protein